MLQTLLSRIGWFLLLLFLQVLVFNHIHIFGYATPMPYVYFLLLLPNNTSRWLYVLLGFLLGLTIDIFSNTPGMAAASMCLSGLLVPPLVKLLTPTDKENETFTPSASSMEWSSFLHLTTYAVIINTLTFFCIEYFSFHNWQVLLINIVGSSVLTLLFIIAIELIRHSSKKK